MKPGPRFQFNIRPPRHEETAKIVGCTYCQNKRRDRQQAGMPGFLVAATMATALLSLASSTNLFGQISAPFTLDPKKAITQYSHDVWHYDQGLPQSAIQAVAQTPEGYIWIGFEEGLARFDGVQFTLFHKGNTPEISYNNIFALTVAGDSSLWIGTNGGGLIRLKTGKFTAYTTSKGLSNDIVRAIYEDRQGNIWIGTNGGLNCLKNGTVTVYTTKEGLFNDVVQSIHQDRQGNIWIGTNGSGLACLKDGRFTHYTTQTGLASDIVTAIYEDNAGNLWIGTYGGLNRRRDGKFALYSTKEGLANNFVRTIYEDRAGSLWIGTNGGGLNRLYNGRFETFATKDGLSNDFVRAILEDKEGSLWIGTYGGGLNRLRDGKFANYSTSHGLSNNMVWSIYEDKSNNLWVGTDRGLNRLKDGKITVYSTPEGMPAQVITALYEDRAENLWIGTDGGGLVRMRDATFTTYTTKDGLSSNFVRFVHEDRSGNLWIGTDAGLNHFKDGKFKAYNTADGLSNNELTCVYEDRAGNLWIGTRTGGLNRFKDGKFFVYTTANGLASDLVRCIYEDDGGSLWIGTNGGGLSRYKDGNFFSFTTKEGLFDDVAFQILEDSQGNFWINCNRGIFRVNKKELAALAQGKIKSVTSVAYGKADGMKTNECNGGLGQPSTWKTRDGKFWFSTIAGAATIDPTHIKLNTLPPPVLVEQLIVDNHPTQTEKRPKLPAGSKTLEFHYTGLSFLAPQKVQFKYKLEGFDRDWVAAGTRRAAYYTNISPGDYTFRVIACNNDGVWNETGAALAFYLEPFFYQTGLFYFLCLVALLLTGASAYRFRARQIRSREAREALRQANEALETRVQERTTDLIRANEALRQSEERFRRLNEELELRVIGRTAELYATNLALEREVAERKRAQEALQESEGRLLQLAENINEVLWMESVDANRLIYVSPVYEKVWGRSRESLLANPSAFIDYVHPDDRESFKAHLGLQRRGQISEMEYRITLPDGTVRWIWDRGFPIRNGDGHVYRSAGISEDVTARKQVEEQLRHYTDNLEKLVEERAARIQELERQRAESDKLATTGRMAARIAHEINNPLAGIKNSFLLLKDAIPSTHQHYEYVGRIEREIDRIARIIRQMFDLYRQEQDEVRRFRAADAIHDVIALLEPSFREHGVRCEIDAENAATVVALPEGLLRQVLYNVIQNAIEASPVGGVVKVAAAVADNAMNISVADQGPGISDETRGRIFEPFFTTKSKLPTGGLGLGLSVSKSLVESMRGTLAFETQIGAGTVFRITLPLKSDVN